MEVLWPGVLPPLILVSPIAYLTEPTCIPMGSRMFTANRAPTRANSVTEVPTQRRGGEETHSAWGNWLGSASQHRVPPVTGPGEGRSQSTGRREPRESGEQSPVLGRGRYHDVAGAFREPREKAGGRLGGQPQSPGARKEEPRAGSRREQRQRGTVCAAWTQPGDRYGNKTWKQSLLTLKFLLF